LDAHHGTVAGVDALDFAGDEAVGNVGGLGAAKGFGQRGAEQAERTHFGEDGGVGALVAVGVDDAGQEFFLGVAAGSVAGEALVFGELGFEVEGVGPVEVGLAGVRLGRHKGFA